MLGVATVRAKLARALLAVALDQQLAAKIDGDAEDDDTADRQDLVQVACDKHQGDDCTDYVKRHFRHGSAFCRESDKSMSRIL